MFVFYFVCSVCFFLFLCIVSHFILIFRTSLPTTATGWKPNCSKYHIIILKWIFNKWDGGKDWIDLAQVSGSCIWGNGSSGSIKFDDFLD